MKRYKLLKDLPGYKAGEVFNTDEKLRSWGYINRLLDSVSEAYESGSHKWTFTDWFEELPHPPAKETYYIDFCKNGEVDSVYYKTMPLTPDAADALSKAIEALLQYCNDTPKNQAMPFYPKYLVDACELARAAIIQDGSAA